jgi:hypothetical protein
MNMRLLIKTKKPDEIEQSIKEATEKIKKGFKPNRALKFAMRLARIDSKTIGSGIYSDYKRDFEKNEIEWTIVFPMEEHTKSMMLGGLIKEFEKIDIDVRVREIK